MKKIDRVFKNKKGKIFSVFFTAGFPQLNSTKETILSLQNIGVDFVEVGIPFSDPLADGPVIQNSASVALKNGMTLNLLFDQLKEIQEEVKIPLILMGYFNPILNFGIEKFCRMAADIGIESVIIPDLPAEYFESHCKLIFEKYGIENIFLITPQTSEERIRKMDDMFSSFIYVVSAPGTTGSQSPNQAFEKEDYFNKLSKLNLKSPLVVGFGVKDRQDVLLAEKYTSGTICGSAYIQLVSESGDVALAAEILKNKLTQLN